jgi:hypothetical protein
MKTVVSYCIGWLIVAWFAWMATWIVIAALFGF